MLGGYYLGQQYLGISGYSGSGILVIQDTIHSHLADNIVVSQLHNLLLDDSYHSQSADLLALLEYVILAPNNSSHTTVSDMLSLLQQHNLLVDNTLHGHIADNLAILRFIQIWADAAYHGIASDSPSISQSMFLNKPHDSIHHIISDFVHLLQLHNLSVDDAYNRQTVNNILKLINWDELGVFYGLYKPDGTKSGALTPEDIAAALILKNEQTNSGILTAVETEQPGLYKPNNNSSGIL